jgi:hypothetical protein
MKPSRIASTKWERAPMEQHQGERKKIIWAAPREPSAYACLVSPASPHSAFWKSASAVNPWRNTSMLSRTADQHSQSARQHDNDEQNQWRRLAARPLGKQCHNQTRSVVRDTASAYTVARGYALQSECNNMLKLLFTRTELVQKIFLQASMICSTCRDGSPRL